jgi:hypothetical protein
MRQTGTTFDRAIQRECHWASLGPAQRCDRYTHLRDSGLEQRDLRRTTEARLQATLVRANAVLKNPSKIECSNINKTGAYNISKTRIKNRLFYGTIRDTLLCINWEGFQ